jgi:uncharacterized protein YgiM (DUF1202 family)
MVGYSHGHSPIKFYKIGEYFMNKKTILYLLIVILFASQIACAISSVSTTTPSPPVLTHTPQPTKTQFIYPTVKVENKTKIAIVSNCSYLNLRVLPTDTSQILFSIPAGEKLEVTGELKNGWYPIYYKEYSGYVYFEYVILTP